MSQQPGVFRRGAVEFVVIVIGVLVALGLESWWQGQQERGLEREYLQSLQEEARRGLSSVESTTAVSDLKRRWLQRAYRILQADLVADSAALFLEGVLQGSGIPVVPLISDAVFQDMLSTGRLGLVQDDVKRRAIVRGYSNIDAMLERRDRAHANIDSELHAVVSRHTPVGVTNQVGPRLRIVDDPARLPEIRRAALRLANEPDIDGLILAAFRVLDHERNVLEQLGLAIEDQLALLEGREPAPRDEFLQMIQADAAAFSTSGSTDSAGTR